MRMNSRLGAFSASPSASFRELVIALLILGMVLSAPLAAQTITIRLLNGKSGRPLTNKNVTLAWSPGYFMQDSVVHFGQNGIGMIQVPVGAEFITMMGGPKVGKESYRIAFIDCNATFAERIQITQVLKNGYVPRNNCGKKSAIPRPGEIVFWAMPNPWWMPDMQ
jgi:hypothetical protein